MARSALRRDPHPLALVTTSLVAWLLLAVAERGLMPPAFCSTGVLRLAPLTTSFKLALLLNGPATLASSWILMLAAMMLPLLGQPLRHVHDRMFANRRIRAMLLFIIGYFMVWLAAGAVLQPLALALRSSIPASILNTVLAVGVALLWQISPAKQWCLNRCHRRPQLAAFGAAADRDAIVFGLASGASCTGACWALMLLPLSITHGHLLAMVVITLFVLGERLERPTPPAWRWRFPLKALRILAAQAGLAVRRLGEYRSTKTLLETH
jgi:predicted metal-binding membrane protein